MKKSMKLFGLISFIAAAVLVSGCSTSKEKIFPPGDTTIHDVWNKHSDGGAKQELIDARSVLRRSINGSQINNQQAYTRTAANEIYSQFQRLPNPDLVMYVYPHLAGSEGAPVPGYSTVFPLYNKVQYAMPGERVEGY